MYYGRVETKLHLSSMQGRGRQNIARRRDEEVLWIARIGPMNCLNWFFLCCSLEAGKEFEHNGWFPSSQTEPFVTQASRGHPGEKRPSRKYGYACRAAHRPGSHRTAVIRWCVSSLPVQLLRTVRPMRGASVRRRSASRVSAPCGRGSEKNPRHPTRPISVPFCASSC